MKQGIFSFGRVMVVLIFPYLTTAQTVDFNNNRNFPTPADRRVYSFDGTPLVGTNFLARLLCGADAASLQVVPTTAVARFRPVPSNDPLAGTWSGGTRTLTGFSPGQTVTLAVQVWDSTGGATYETASIRMQSATFTYTIPQPGAQVTAYYIDNFRAIGPLSPPASGTVNFENRVLPEPPDRKVYDVHGNLLTGTNYVAQLYYGASLEGLFSSPAPPARFRAEGTPFPGTWTGGIRTLAGFPPGQTVYMQVYVWDSAVVSSYAQATENTTGTQYGRSDVFTYVIPASGAPGPSYDIDGFRSFMLVTNPPDRTLVIRENGDRVELLYSGTHTIQGAPSLAGPWTTLTTSSAPYTDPASGTNRQRFYRMQDEPGPTYSLNVVGYYRLDVCQGFSMIANQFHAPGGNTVRNVLKSPLESTSIFKFNVFSAGYLSISFLGGAWEGDDVEMTLSPGEGAFLYTPVAQSLRFLGEVPLSGSVSIAQGFSIISAPLPRQGPLNQMSFPTAGGLCIFQWTCGATGYRSNCYINGWEGDDNGNVPAVGLGDSFWLYNPGPPITWNGIYCIDCP